MARGLAGLLDEEIEKGNDKKRRKALRKFFFGKLDKPKKGKKHTKEEGFFMFGK